MASEAPVLTEGPGTFSRARFLTPLAIASSAAAYSAVVTAPLIAAIAADLDVTVGSAALLVAAYTFPGIAAALFSGSFSDRFGRERFMIGGLLLGGAFTMLGALAPSFESLLLSRALAGLATALVVPNIMAAVADRFEYAKRGSAISLVITANASSAIFGVAFAGIVAERFGWRPSLAIAGLLGIVAAAVLLRTMSVLRPARPVSGGFLAPFARILRDRSAVAMLGSHFLQVASVNTWAIFLVTFLQLSFGVAQGLASTLALVQGFGALVGNQFGGPLGDRVGHRRIILLATSLYAALILLASTSIALPVTLALNFAAATVFGARGPANITLLTEQAIGARATVMALAAAANMAAITIGTAIAGGLVDHYGFLALGAFCAIAAVAGGIIPNRFVREHRIEAAS